MTYLSNMYYSLLGKNDNRKSTNWGKIWIIRERKVKNTILSNQRHKYLRINEKKHEAKIFCHEAIRPNSTPENVDNNSSNSIHSLICLLFFEYVLSARYSSINGECNSEYFIILRT